ncbi:MAG: NADH-quinone oxidoreductase subunit N, partial [Chloroflexota bacterium]|nr:NADH-quinone oxidoreductase subunit N [Chloroflexota bacterium]
MTFTYSVTAADWGRVIPELVMVGIVIIVMLTDLLMLPRGKNPQHHGPTNFTALPLISVMGIVATLIVTIVQFTVGDHLNAFNQMIGSDYGSLFAYIIILTASGIGLLLSPAYLKRLNLVHQGEYYALYLLATIGMMIMAAATNFLTIFLGLEMLSLALYILCGFVSRRLSSQESGMKYFLLSSFASAFLLYGMALTYGATGHTSFDAINAFLNHPPTGQIQAHTMLLVAMGLLIVGFAFKVSAVPFQAWTPDVYDGAPAPITAFMSVGTKAAALIAFMRVFDVVLFPLRGDWLPIVWAITVLTIVGGNILALVQNNVKRMLAYSSIAHAGYLLIGIVAAGEAPRLGLNLSTPFDLTSGKAAIFFYLFSYAFLNLGAFGVVAVLERADNTGSRYSDIKGLWYRRPILTGLLAFFLLGLAGFPPMAGFAAKYYLFYAAFTSGHPELVIIGVLASILGMYYY